MRQRLRELLEALQQNGDTVLAARISAALGGTDADVEGFLVSNALWAARALWQTSQVPVRSGPQADERSKPRSFNSGTNRFKLVE